MDALDKLAFSFPTMVRALLRLLPKALTAELDPRTLQRFPTAHVGPGLRRRRRHALAHRLPVCAQYTGGMGLTAAGRRPAMPNAFHVNRVSSVASSVRSAAPAVSSSALGAPAPAGAGGQG